MTHSPQAILFDMGYTLLGPHPTFEDVVVYALARQGVESDVEIVRRHEIAAWREAVERNGDCRFTLNREHSRAFWDTFYRILLGRIGLDATPERVEGLMQAFTCHDNYAFYDDVFPVLERIRARGVRVGVISNWETWLHDLLDAHGVRAAFEPVIVSGSVGCEKPDKAIFQLGFAAIGVSPDRCMYVGDSVEHDVEPMLALGGAAVLIDRRQRWHGRTLPCPRITSLYELIALI